MDEAVVGKKKASINYRKRVEKASKEKKTNSITSFENWREFPRKPDCEAEQRESTILKGFCVCGINRSPVSGFMRFNLTFENVP